MSRNCDCGDAQDQIYQYLDDELDERTAHSIREHLDECDGCLDSFDFERRLKSVIRDHLEEDMPEAIEARVKQLIREQSA